eukprot:TRINITY_DN12641_c0_g1_i1.p1 TRINITY_DN12641_c0_g1~~TRINITY_DN12641_c0_g1_i1.p1  ORF type:complete len:623 (-),score=95.59 TRINITY_DN12641_c0_g1_i1:22-1890(-)
MAQSSMPQTNGGPCLAAPPTSMSAQGSAGASTSSSSTAGPQPGTLPRAATPGGQTTRALRLQISDDTGASHVVNAQLLATDSVLDLKAKIQRGDFGTTIPASSVRCLCRGKLLGDSESIGSLPDGSMVQCYFLRSQPPPATPPATNPTTENDFLQMWALSARGRSAQSPPSSKGQDAIFHSLFAFLLAASWTFWYRDEKDMDNFGRSALCFFSLLWLAVCVNDVLRSQGQDGLVDGLNQPQASTASQPRAFAASPQRPSTSVASPQRSQTSVPGSQLTFTQLTLGLRQHPQQPIGVRHRLARLQRLGLQRPEGLPAPLATVTEEAEEGRSPSASNRRRPEDEAVSQSHAACSSGGGPAAQCTMPPRHGDDQVAGTAQAAEHLPSATIAAAGTVGSPVEPVAQQCEARGDMGEAEPAEYGCGAAAQGSPVGPDAQQHAPGGNKCHADVVEHDSAADRQGSLTPAAWAESEAEPLSEGLPVSPTGSLEGVARSPGQRPSRMYRPAEMGTNGFRRRFGLLPRASVTPSLSPGLSPPGGSPSRSLSNLDLLAASSMALYARQPAEDSASSSTPASPSRTTCRLQSCAMVADSADAAPCAEDDEQQAPRRPAASESGTVESAALSVG